MTHEVEQVEQLRNRGPLVALAFASLLWSAASCGPQITGDDCRDWEQICEGNVGRVCYLNLDVQERYWHGTANCDGDAYQCVVTPEAESYGPICASGGEPTPGCQQVTGASPATEHYCEGDNYISCRQGYQTGDKRCRVCSIASDDDCIGGLEWDCEGDQDCAQGLQCLVHEAGLSPSCAVACDCAQDERCDTCLAFSSKSTCFKGLCRGF